MNFIIKTKQALTIKTKDLTHLRVNCNLKDPSFYDADANSDGGYCDAKMICIASLYMIYSLFVYSIFS